MISKDGYLAMAKDMKFPFDLDISSLDTGSITNILNDIDRALSVNEDEGLALIRSKMWSELSSDGVTKIETKGGKFDPTKMEAITTLPPSDEYPANSVIDELESGYMYKDRVLTPARVVVSSDQ